MWHLKCIVQRPGWLSILTERDVIISYHDLWGLQLFFFIWSVAFSVCGPLELYPLTQSSYNKPFGSFDSTACLCLLFKTCQGLWCCWKTCLLWKFTAQVCVFLDNTFASLFLFLQYLMSLENTLNELLWNTSVWDCVFVSLLCLIRGPEQSMLYPWLMS